MLLKGITLPHSSLNQSAKRYRVASINLFNFIEPPAAFYDFENIYTQAQWQGKLAWFSDWVTSANPDMIGFQEVFSPQALAAWAKDNGYPHFAVIDEPTLVNDYTYKNPVVAFASRFPITDFGEVGIDKDACELMGLSRDFGFSRKPLRATVELPEFGALDCYVIHFKSKRNQLDDNLEYRSSMTGAAEFVAKQVLGKWGASLQRGSEATALYYAMLARRFESTNPYVLMGDFNDKLASDLFSAFRQSQRIFRSDISDANLAKQSDTELKASLQQFAVFDSYELHFQGARCNKTLAQDEFETSLDELNQLESHSASQRSATHYYGNVGSVLDYILVSSEFNPAALQNLAQVVDYQTFDRHLIKPDYERDKDSTDHAPVMMTFELRR
ncbi:endonuclease [Shewanella sp. WXL01]|nr:endonuclease [Shewanella sp. WXL01]